MGAQASLGPNIYIYIYIVFIYFISIDRPLSKTLGPLLLNKPNWPHPNSNYPTQKFNKNNKNIHNGNCILAKKKTYFTTKEPKNNVLLEKLNFFFFTTTVN